MKREVQARKLIDNIFPSNIMTILIKNKNKLYEIRDIENLIETSHLSYSPQSTPNQTLSGFTNFRLPVVLTKDTHEKRISLDKAKNKTK